MTCTCMRTATFGDMQWWASTRRFATVNTATVAFQKLNDHGQRKRGALNVGVYRHGEPPVNVTVVGHDQDGVAEALTVLENLGGKLFEIDDESLTRLVYRRARVVLAMAEAAPGAYRFPHPTPSTIDESGNIVDL
jgi:hypothetical protein